MATETIVSPGLSVAWRGDARPDGKKIFLEEFYKPPEETQRFIYDVYDKLIRWRSLRDQPYKQFQQQSALTYWADARQKFWGYLPVSFDTDTPQFFFPETRNQIIGILAKIANLRMKPRFEGVKGFDLLTATVFQDLFEYWRRGANRKISNFWQFLYNIVNGTVVVFTAYNSNIRKVKNITMYDAHTGETQYKEEELDESDVEDVIVNLEDLYIPKIWEPDIQAQDELIWRTLVKWKDFKSAFKGYSNAHSVVPGSQFADSSIFADFLSYDVMGSDFVEVIKYFNKVTDQYAIIANGVLLNPIMVKGEEEIAPLPWNHKKLPFSKTIFEPIDVNFFYGMPLAQKVRSAQEALNMMWELMLEREIRSVNAPIITNDPSVELGLEFKAGRIYQVQADVGQFKELTVSPTSSSFWNSLNALQGIIQRTGSGGVGSVAGGKQPNSATQNAQEEEQKKEAAGLPFMFYQDLLEQKVWLTIKNFIQFYTAAKVNEVLGDRKFHKILSISEMKLYGGGMGTHEIRITDKPESRDELKKEAYLRSLFKKEHVDIMEVSPKQLLAVNFDIKIAFEQEESPNDEKMIFMDYLSTVIKLFGQTGLLSPRKMLYRLAEKYNESLSDIVEDSVEQDYEQDRFGVKPTQQPQTPRDKVNAALAAGQQPGGQPAPGGFGAPGGAGGAPAPGAPGSPSGNNAQGQRGQMFGAQGPGASAVKKGNANKNILKKF
jgi:hypothetical protein